MRWSVLICVMAALGAGLAGCSSTPREPARVDYRSGSAYSASPQPVSRACVDGGYTVRSGDTLSEIAERCNVAMASLASANNLSRPYTLRPGQTLTMPRPPVHVVQRGENLYRIGLRYDIPFQRLASHNGIPAPYELEVGQSIQLPSGTTLATAATSAPARSTRPPARTQTPPPQSTLPATQQVANSSVSFDWPIRGSILSEFGRKPDGSRNDGINIEARTGAEVRAAAPGQVVYAGSELAGYGQLILLRHEGGFVTAYAHNSRLMVREGDQVTRGQVIAAAGSSGTVEIAQVHFEIRRGVNPEDPMRYLR
ncbi:LysM peptidoglycan-binding domain-containing protein [Maricaulis salignorans]|uniref:LysM peptidoglycan-binding domain-containing protein n=1 Tax=Maricaulis salignorans TaxID=144026 RepID=UPI003A92964F